MPSLKWHGAQSGLALEQPADQRAAFLEKMCGDDHALRQRVQALLHAADHPGDFLAQGPLPATTPETLREGPGSRIGPYKLLQQIGEGGMGTVFMAEQQEPVRRMVALKLIKPGMDSRSIIARFEAERQALALMDHPNIAKVLDAGTTPSGHPYFVMELVKGIPITKYCDEHRLTPQARLALFVPICKAVQHAHQKGIIHRDLKPSNVLVALYDGQPVPKVIDFGVAKATGSKLTDKTLFTDFGAVVGTLEYMSPEQAERNQLDIDTRSDIYALGVLLYELLTGTTPLERKRLREAALLECLRLIREEEPPRPSLRLSTTEELPSIAARRGLEPKKLSGLVRGDLDWIVMKCLEKDRNRRYETANGLALDVERYLHDEPVLASPPSAWYRLRKFTRRHKSGLRTTAVVGIVLLLAVGGVGWALWEQAAQRQVQRLEQAVRVAETERAVTVALAKVEQSAERAKRLPCTTSMEALAALAEWREAAAGMAEAEAALTTGAATDDLRERVAKMRQRIEQGRIQTQRNEKLFRDLDDARMAMSVIADNHLDYAGAAAKYAAAFAVYDLEVTPDHTDELARRLRAEELVVREVLLVALGDWADAVERAQSKAAARPLRALQQAADDDAWRQRYRAAVAAGSREMLHALSAEAQRSSLPPSSLVLLAQSLYDLEERGEALTLLRWGRSRYPTDFWLHFELGTRLGIMATTPVELEEAIGCLRTAVALRPAASIAHNNLGSALKDKNQLDEAIAEYHKVLDLDPKYAEAHNNLGVALYDKRQLDAAIAEYHKVLDLDPKNALAHSNLGVALYAKNQVDAAITEWRKAIDLNPKSAGAHYDLGNALTAKNQLGDAITEFHQAIEARADFAEAYCNLGDALRRQGRFVESLSFYRRGHELGSKRPDWRYPSAEWVRQAERLAAGEEKLPAFQKGEYQPRDNDEWLLFAQVCKAKQLYRAAAGLYTDAFAADAKLAADLKAAHRYNAACCAALAAAGQGKGDVQLDDPERTQLRKQALAWLRADLDLWSKRLENGKAADGPATRAQLRHWQRDTDLASVREDDALKKLLVEEQEAWRKLWADVADLLKKTGDAK